ncbi:MAG: hypothetical protein WC758_08010 [Candidatus Woesearchaeota archaeon]|jgi:hypothetical protein
MANVDLTNNKIYGCKEGSPVYYHEQGHIFFCNKESGVRINYYQSFFQMLGLFFLSLGVLTDILLIKVIGFVFSLAVILFYLYEEIWCWVYAYKKIKLKTSSVLQTN